MSVVHDTLRFARTVAAPVEAVWQAYADIGARSHWSVPDGEQVVYDSESFTEGGTDQYRCGPPGDLSTRGTIRYVLIEAHRRLAYVDEVRRDGQLLAVALLTWEFEPVEDGVRVSVTDQITSWVGAGMIDGHRNGHTTALDQLARWLA